MAKLNGNYRMFITIAVLLVGMAAAWGAFGQVVTQNTEHIQELKDGKADRELVETQLGYINEKLSNITRLIEKLDK